MVQTTKCEQGEKTTGYRVSDALWSVLEPCLPVHENTHRFGGGKPRVADRQCADGIFYVLRTAANGHR